MVLSRVICGRLRRVDNAYEITYYMGVDVKIYSASEARQNLYGLIRSASTGLRVIEINLRGSEPVVMINKAEMESWLETLDLLSGKEELEIVRKSMVDRNYISHGDLRKKLGV
ncbi:MAG: hypothetical protein UW41_C0031G0006 [Candidatus Collierbacteria bacterium GW2011_GWC2_44_18]|uniref:Antitoxin n=1 Tax=Candidatus Collierbacteria bacterium GW2011_GWC2_44_18 TaxID=1618392 RepID=A0A0G1KKA1_9BACT|nr:MAG: hypothetical protein US48_C0013G0006 [Candidatus Levybacteria bacterium GW2011_GWA2_37_36]KKT29153.1 MAG: hypothetical protein UW16_C0034G0006 [Microgenomates group bacterium GW2011_GWC1_44_10]KKT48379.1 MAG: hypothetical protein UW41_C0031G0006 [Candidatus Collierbacteria bacterium GW2011_GWC2_44_18]